MSPTANSASTAHAAEISVEPNALGLGTGHGRSRSPITQSTEDNMSTPLPQKNFALKSEPARRRAPYTLIRGGRASSLQVVRRRLADDVRDQLDEEIAERVYGTRLDSDADQAILAGIGARALRRHLPNEIQHSLHAFTGNGRHALVLENLPKQSFPGTPVNGFADEPSLAHTNAIHFGLIQVLGVTPFSVPYENNGRLIRNVVPNPAATGTASSWGADSEFFWHTDNPHLPFDTRCGDPRVSPPRYLAFYAVRNDEQVPTELAALEDALQRLEPPMLRWLRAPAFEVGPPDSVKGEVTFAELPLVNTPVLEPSMGGERVRYDQGTTKGLDSGAHAALEDWAEALGDVPAVPLVMSPGEFLIFDNHRVLHKRKAFTPAARGSERWLRRCYAG